MYPQCPAEGAADTFSPPPPARASVYRSRGEAKARQSIYRAGKSAAKAQGILLLGTEQLVPYGGTLCSVRRNILFPLGEHVAPRRITIRFRRREQAQRQERGPVSTYPIREDTDPLSLPGAANAAGAIPGRGAADYSMPNSNVVPNSLRMDIVTRFFVRL